MRGAVWSLFLAATVVATPLYAAPKHEPTIDDIRAMVYEQWRGVRDIKVTDRATIIEYHRVAVLSVPHVYKEPIASQPNQWLMMAPGIERLQLWQGAKSVDVSYDGQVTRWQGRRNAFGEKVGRIRDGNHMPVEDISFSYYTGRLNRLLPLQAFLAMPETRYVKSRTVQEIPCYRVRGVCPMDMDGAEKMHEVIIDLAPQYGWLPVRTLISDAATGHPVREYKVKSFFTSGGFPFPREAQVDTYVLVPPRDATSKARPFLANSMLYSVESVTVNGGLSSQEFAFGFEAGTRVTDERTGASYVAGDGMAMSR